MAPRVDKKYIKLGVVGLAASALIIGLSVGLTQRNKNARNASAANANNDAGVTSSEFNIEERCIPYPKSGKSGGGTKSGKAMSMPDGRARLGGKDAKGNKGGFRPRPDEGGRGELQIIVRFRATGLSTIPRVLDLN